MKSEPRTLYRVTVDLERWIAADPGPDGTPHYRPRRHPSSTKNDYTKPIYTASSARVAQIRTVFGGEYVTVKSVEISSIEWR